MQVNRDGERFVNEHEGYSESALFVLAQPGATAFMIYDERVHEIGLTMPNYATAVTSGSSSANRCCAIWRNSSA